MTTEKRDKASNGNHLDRRTFIKTTGVAAGVVSGIEVTDDPLTRHDRLLNF